MPEFNDYRTESKKNWGTSGTLTIEQIQTGAILRIADATEVMAKEYNNLLRDRNWYKETAERRGKEIESLRRSNAALRGHIGRIKRSKA